MSEDNSVALINSWAFESNEFPEFFYFIVLVPEKAQDSSWKKQIVTKSCVSCGLAESSQLLASVATF